MTHTGSDAVEGWYEDPYGLHEQRWFSAGTPTALVRDHGTEGHDEPPAYPPPVAPVEAPEVVGKFPQDDLKRADEAEGGYPDHHPDDPTRLIF